MGWGSIMTTPRRVIGCTARGRFDKTDDGHFSTSASVALTEGHRLKRFARLFENGPNISPRCSKMCSAGRKPSRDVDDVDPPHSLRPSRVPHPCLSIWRSWK
jgi:hypothetical protein